MSLYVVTPNITGLSMTQIEMEKIADTFDKNRSGLIDLADIIAILKGHKVRSRPVVERQMSDAEKIEFEVGCLSCTHFHIQCFYCMFSVSFVM